VTGFGSCSRLKTKKIDILLTFLCRKTKQQKICRYVLFNKQGLFAKNFLLENVGTKVGSELFVKLDPDSN
jgi:hypothetical protein